MPSPADHLVSSTDRPSFSSLKWVPHPSWQKKGDGAQSFWHQPYGFQEGFYNKISVKPGERGLFLICICVRFRCKTSTSGNEPQDLAPILRRAWIEMRRLHPTIACTADETGKTYRSPTTKAELDEWVEQSFQVRPGETSDDIFKEGFKRRYVTLFYLPKRGELFLQSEHLHLDGAGGLCLLDRFFQTVASLVVSSGFNNDDNNNNNNNETATEQNELAGFQDNEISRLPPRADDLLGMGVMSSRASGASGVSGESGETGRANEAATSLVSSLLRPMDMGGNDIPISLPVKDVHTELGNILHYQHKFDARTSLAISRACRALGLTVTAAWHAAVILATVKCQIAAGQKPGSKYAVFSNFSLRPYFPEPETERDGKKEVDAYAVSNYHTIIPSVVQPAGRSFQQIAGSLASFYRKGLSPRPAIFAALPRLMAEVALLYTNPGAPNTDTTPAVSSLGVLENVIRHTYGPMGKKGELVVEDLWGGDTVTGPWIECFLWSWRGSLVLSGCYNSAFYTEEDVEVFFEWMTRIMMEGLGIGVSKESRL